MNTRNDPSTAFFPDIPVEVKAARIGTCFNTVSRELMSKTIVIDPDRLKKRMLQFISGSAHLELKAYSGASEAFEGTFLSIGTEAKANFFTCRASIGFKASVAQSSSANSQTLNCYCSHVFKDQRLRLINTTDTYLLYNAMSDEFQNSYQKLVTSKTPEDYIRNYFEFIKKFGHGCVTELYLTSGSAFMMTAEYKDRAKASEYEYGGTFSVSSPFVVEASVASNYAKKIANLQKDAKMHLRVENLPETTPTAHWCNELATNVAQKGFDLLGQKPDMITPYKGEPATPPIPPDGEPTDNPVPKGESIDINEDLQNKIMKDDNFNGTWDEYLEAQDNAYNETKPVALVAQIQANLQAIMARRSKLKERPQNECPTGSSENSATTNEEPSLLDLGQYVPFAYKITPWSELFPDLFNAGLFTTFTSIYIAKLYVYYLTRIQFHGYLHFLRDVGKEICRNDYIDTDPGIFGGICNDLLDQINNRVKNEKITAEDYEELVSWFELKIKNHQHFQSKKVYEAFFSNYEFFVENAFGFIVVVHDENRYFSIREQTGGGASYLPKPFGLLPMLKDAIRAYPVLRFDGTKVFTHYTINFWDSTKWEIFGDKQKHEEETTTVYYYFKIRDSKTLKVQEGLRYYGVGYKDIPKTDEELEIYGAPIFDNLPFEEVTGFCRPLNYVKYPAYQTFKDVGHNTWCSRRKVRSHAEGARWIDACLAAHPGLHAQGTPQLSNRQRGTIWP